MTINLRKRLSDLCLRSVVVAVGLATLAGPASAISQVIGGAPLGAESHRPDSHSSVRPPASTQGNIPGTRVPASSTDSLETPRPIRRLEIGVPGPVMIGGVSYGSPVTPPWYLLVSLMGSVLAFSLLALSRSALRHAITVAPRTGKSQQIGVPGDSLPTVWIVLASTAVTLLGSLPFVFSRAGSTDLVGIYLYMPELLLPIPLVAAFIPLAFAAYFFTSSWALLRPAATRASVQARGVSLSGGVFAAIGLAADLLALGLFLGGQK